MTLLRYTEIILRLKYYKIKHMKSVVPKENIKWSQIFFQSRTLFLGQFDVPNNFEWRVQRFSYTVCSSQQLQCFPLSTSPPDGICDN